MSKPQPARYRTTNWSDCNSAFRRRGSLLVRLDLLVDSTGLKFLGDGAWQARKHGTQRRRVRRRA